MNRYNIGLLVLGVSVLGAMAPTAAMAQGSSPDMPRLVITMVCTIQLDDVVSAMDFALGLNMGQFMPNCEMSMEVVEAQQKTAAVSVPEGSLFPVCSTNDACFEPYAITVEPGTAVTWTNHDNVLHTVTGKEPHPDGNFDSWVLPGEEFTFTFRTEGTYLYGCTVHPWAAGVVTVDAATAMASGSAAPAPSGAELNRLSQGVVEEMIALYAEHGADSFAMLEGLAPEHERLRPALVVDAGSHLIVGQTGGAEFVGHPIEPLLGQSSVSFDVLVGLLGVQEAGMWFDFPRMDVNTNLDRLDRVWLKLHDGYVFMGGYSAPLGVQNAAS